MTREHDAVALAGRLAEHGVARVELVAPDGSRRSLHARETDLPGLLRTAPAGTRIVWPGGAAEVRADSITWVLDPPAH